VKTIGRAAFAVSLSILALSPGASAQEWSGFYLGANLGGIWGSSDATTNVDCSGSPVTSYICAAGFIGNGLTVNRAGSGSLSDDGIIGGGQAGYNAQSGNFVYGFELDLSALDLSASRQGSGTYPPNGVTAGNAFTIGSSVEADWLFTARGRLGWSVSHVLLYATGGLALADVEVRSNYSDNLILVGPGGSGFASGSKTKAGYVVGGGAEVALTDDWTLRGEYLFVDFGSVSASGTVSNPDFPGGSNSFTVSDELSAHIARAGINYRFGDLH
jgi:outer membrane immunogenic protein